MSRVLLNASEPKDAIKRGALVRDLVRRGHEVHLTTPDLDDHSRQVLLSLGATPHQLSLDRTGRSVLNDLRYAAALRRLMRRIRPDLTLSFTIKPNIWSALAASTLRIRSAIVVTGLGYSFLGSTSPRQRAVQWIGRRLYGLAAARAAHIVFQNPDDRADFRAAGLLKHPSRAFVVNGSGVDIDHFSPVPLSPSPVFLMVTRLIRGKGVAEFVEAAGLARAAVPDAKFVIAGGFEEGPDAITREEMDSWSGGAADYIGFFPDVREVIARASVVVLPSWREGTPRSLLEAMAMGRPIITTDAPGCRETTIDGVNGKLIPVRNPKALAKAMIALAASPAERERMGLQSRRIAEERYAVGLVHDHLLGRLGL